MKFELGATIPLRKGGGPIEMVHSWRIMKWFLNTLGDFLADMAGTSSEGIATELRHVYGD